MPVDDADAWTRRICLDMGPVGPCIDPNATNRISTKKNLMYRIPKAVGDLRSRFKFNKCTPGSGYDNVSPFYFLNVNVPIRSRLAGTPFTHEERDIVCSELQRDLQSHLYFQRPVTLTLPLGWASVVDDVRAMEEVQARWEMVVKQTSLHILVVLW